jgi:hypothetical protein
MTLAEFVIVTGLLGVVLGVLAIAYTYFLRSFGDLQNYMDMSAQSRYAMDRMSREIRQAESISAFASNHITIVRSNINTTYTYDPTAKTLSRQSGNASAELYLKGCDYFRFDVFQRMTTTNSFDLSNAPTATVAKVVQLDFVGSRLVLGSKLTTDSQQSAKVVLRKF